VDEGERGGGTQEHVAVCPVQGRAADKHGGQSRPGRDAMPMRAFSTRKLPVARPVLQESSKCRITAEKADSRMAEWPSAGRELSALKGQLPTGAVWKLGLGEGVAR